MAKKKLYDIGVKQISNHNWVPYIEIDHQVIHLTDRIDKETAEWCIAQAEIALDRLIQKAKKQQ